MTAVRVALLGLQLECSCVGKQRQSTRNCSRAASRLKLQGGMSSHLSCFPTYRLPVERTSKRISTQGAGTGVTRDARAGQAGELGSVVLCQSATRVQKVMQPAALSHTHQSHSTLEHSHYAHGHTSASRRSSRSKPHRYSQRSTSVTECPDHAVVARRPEVGGQPLLSPHGDWAGSGTRICR